MKESSSNKTINKINLYNADNLSISFSRQNYFLELRHTIINIENSTTKTNFNYNKRPFSKNTF